MEAEILKIVQDKLPSIHADALGAYFDEAKLTRENLEIVKKKLSKADVTIEMLTKANEMHLEQARTADKLQEREDNVLEREVKQRVQDVRLQCEIEKVSIVKEMFKDVFRNTEVKRSIIGNTPVKGQDGCYPESAPFNRDETVTQE